MFSEDLQHLSHHYCHPDRVYNPNNYSYTWLLIEAVCVADGIALEHNLITKFSEAVHVLILFGQGVYRLLL